MSGIIIDGLYDFDFWCFNATFNKIDGLNMYEKLTQVQSGSLDLKSSMLKSCNTFLQLNILVTIGSE